MSAQRNDGGPAFPVPLNPGQPWQGMAPCDGMTLRDYFIAHAPAEPQRWFKPKQPQQPVREQFESYASYQRAFDAWLDDCNKQLYVEWPAAWADEMLKAREGGAA